jgi:hypothetical protein
MHCGSTMMRLVLAGQNFIIYVCSLVKYIYILMLETHLRYSRIPKQR